MIFKIRWFFDRKFRAACDYYKSVLKLLASRQDIMAPEEVTEIREKAADLKVLLRRSAPIGTINDSVNALESTVVSLIKPYPNSTLRDILRWRW